jgi:hypothetical protein
MKRLLTPHEQHEPNNSKLNKWQANSALANGTNKIIYCSMKCKQKDSGAEMKSTAEIRGLLCGI